MSQSDWPNHPQESHRLRVQKTQVLAAMATVLATAWICTMGAIPAIFALVTAKHVLVAIMAMGLGINAPRRKTI